MVHVNVFKTCAFAQKMYFYFFYLIKNYVMGFITYFRQHKREVVN